LRSAAANSTRLFYQPVTAVLGAVSLALTGYVLWLTLNDISLLKPTAGHFVGVDNYLRLATDSRGLAALWRTVKFTIATAGVEVLLGLAIAMFLDREFPGRRLVRSLLLTPIIMTPVVVGLTWRFMFDPATGMINYLLSLVGVSRPIDWLGDPNIALIAVTIADVWQWTPFVVLLTLAALESLPTEPLDAARVDGAREWQVTWYVLLPMLKRVLAIVALIRAIDSVKAFDLFYIMTRGGPALSTETLNLYGFIAAFTNFDISFALTIALTLTIVTNVALLAVYGLMFPDRGEGAR
jgi:multiple sugar transport system permease protein